MKNRMLLAALALVIGVNTLVLLNVTANRRGAPDATLTLTERELGVGWRGLHRDEDSGVALELRYEVEEEAYAWFDEQKLRALGFEPAPHRPDHAKRPLPRQAYLALEYDGPRWAALVTKLEARVATVREEIPIGKSTEDELKRQVERLDELRSSGSRLVPIDVDKDGAALRARYPDRSRYLVTAANVRLHYTPPARGGNPQGYISEILTSPIHVPARFHATLEQATSKRNDGGAYRFGYRHPPRYRVTVNFGARFEPWISDVRLIESPGS